MSRQRWKADLSRSASAGESDVIFRSGSKVSIIFAFEPPRKGATAIERPIFVRRKCRYPIGSIAAAYRATIAQRYRSESDTAFHPKHELNEAAAIAADL
jgi:hypothetical protein